MGFWERLQAIDRRFIYVLVFIVILIPLFNPLGLPLEISAWTQQSYDYVEANVQAGDLVIMSMDYSVGASADIHPIAVAVTNHLMEKGARIAYIAFFPDGANFADKIIATHVADGKVYGTDVINLGYLAGQETAITAFVRDIHESTRGVDYHGRPLHDTEIGRELEDINSADLVAIMAAGTPGVPEWARQAEAVYGSDILAGVVAVIAPNSEPYLQSGQLKGLWIGLKGAGEYEVVSGIPGPSAALMDSQSMGHFLIILFVLLGNLGYAFVASKPKKRSGGAS